MALFNLPVFCVCSSEAAAHHSLGTYNLALNATIQLLTVRLAEASDYLRGLKVLPNSYTL
jgi:hypothetical protein